MSKHVRYILAAELALAVIGFAVVAIVAMLPPSPGVVKANFDRIEKGMTKAEVDSFFGDPPMAPMRVTETPGEKTVSVWLWRCRDGDAEIVFEDSIVVSMEWINSD